MKIRLLIALVSLTLICGCGPQGASMRSIGSSILSQTGYISGSEADALFSAGEEISKASRGFSAREEYYLGRGVAAMVLARNAALTKPALTQYVSQVGSTLAALSDRPELFRGYHFAVLDTSEVNAMATPSGFIFVTRGFLKLLPNEDALAAVLAHEIGHVIKGHGMAAISEANVSNALLSLGKAAAESRGGAEVSVLTSVFGDSVKEIFGTLIDKGYSRSQEYEADAYAVELMARSGYDPNSIVNVLQSLEKLQAGNHAGWFATHPEPSDRVDEVRDQLADIKVKSDSTRGLAARTVRFKKATQGLA